MIHCEHFIYSLSTGLIASVKVEKYLTELELDYLCHIGDGAKEEKCFRTPINPFIIALTYIKPIKDEYKRKIIWNHTILIRYQDYFEDHELEPAKLVAPYFLQPTKELPKNLEPIKI